MIFCKKKIYHSFNKYAADFFFNFSFVMFFSEDATLNFEIQSISDDATTLTRVYYNYVSRWKNSSGL